MTAMPAPPIAPVLILSTGRCGSTMVSEMLNRHPGVLSLSEFFIPLGPEGFAWQRPDGARMWKTFSRQSPALHAMIKDGIVVSENLYPFDRPGARFRADTMPPIISVTLPHLTNDYEALYDELEAVVKPLPAMPLADQYRHFFGHLARKFERRVWVERSGGSLMLAAKLLRLFPDARVIHVYRDGRDTAMSMSQHRNFQVLIASIRKSARFFNARKAFRRDRTTVLDVAVQHLAFRFLKVEKLLEYPLTLADYGAFWNEMIQVGHLALKDLPPHRLLNVKFEEVQQDPREKLQELIRFIDPSLDDPAWLDEVAAIPKPARSQFTRLPAAEQAALTRACAPGLELLGYPL